MEKVVSYHADVIRASPAVLNMWPCKHIFHIQVLVFVLFCNSANKFETGTANMWGTSNSKPLGSIIRWGAIRNTENQLDHIYYTLFCRCTTLLLLHHLPTLAIATRAIMLSQNHFPEPNHLQRRWIFVHPIFLSRRCSLRTIPPMLLCLTMQECFSHPRLLLIYWFACPTHEHESERYSKGLELINNKPLTPINTSDQSGGAGLIMCLQPRPASSAYWAKKHFWVGTSLLLILGDKFLLRFIQNMVEMLKVITI